MHVYAISETPPSSLSSMDKPQQQALVVDLLCGDQDPSTEHRLLLAARAEPVGWSPTMFSIKKYRQVI
jgi:hypothetical protein